MNIEKMHRFRELMDITCGDWEEIKDCVSAVREGKIMDMFKELADIAEFRNWSYHKTVTAATFFVFARTIDIVGED